MAISPYHSTVTLPKCHGPSPSLLDFLIQRFPFVGREIWEARILSGKVLSEDGKPVSPDMPYVPLKQLYYFKEVEKEPAIPFTEEVIFSNQELLVACKPHFLPVTPSGPFVNECLLHRLKKRTGLKDLSPINRIDRETAGLVLFSMNKKTRGRYQEMFMTGQVKKTYEAVTHCPSHQEKNAWQVKNRIVKGEPWFRMKTAPGEPNAISKIVLVASKKNRARFHLHPVTGKKHQLRLHLCELGFPILNDRVYPTLLPEEKTNFNTPLQLLAKRVEFRDPLTGRQMRFESNRKLISSF